MIIPISVFIFTLGMVFLFKGLLMSQGGDPAVMENKKGRIRRITAEIGALREKLDEETEERKKDEEIIQSLQGHIGRLEHERAGKEGVSGERVSNTAEFISSVEDLKKVAAEQKKAARDIKKHVEEDKIKFRL
ncbi:MAG: hypothetical protein V3S04_00885 [Candidatus Omnitrophota bacterium]